MKTLFINTASPKTRIALHDGSDWIADRSWPAEQNEAEKLQPAVDALLKEEKLSPDDIDQLLVCIGPGGFTSVRVGVSAANAWSFAKQVSVAAVSIFDLYQTDAMVIVTANANETWLMEAGKEPQWVERGGMGLSDRFSFTGNVNDEWRAYLEEQGGSFIDQEEQLPAIDQLEFKQEIIKPWYYKDANITWSKKNLPKSD